MQEAPVVRNVMPDVKLPEKNIPDSMPCKTETKSAESAKQKLSPKDFRSHLKLRVLSRWLKKIK